ncbi:MAG: ABC transporter ATP-binding protein [Armatimonadota bacterium]|nr:ABC transporter ATP-binding protein [Armatimonadota bacterium]MDR7439570.1 ABC transporter ATP-binding protein [Armatimonadota bacterium]MDR7562751.1 ABC transporter ATP-binding protein [Armatimonadota bacterium]MDR7568660.1 ABC transporter ATP-binding protein [Armatimonadota bacterium]MDR7601050.1 ABC transporter ATP-binding protein [Armatimonadota bacterium]
MILEGRITLTDLHKSFGTQVVLRGVSLMVEPGESVAILGPSGAGKSVLLKHVVGLLHPDRGEVRIDGHVVHALRDRELAALRMQMGMVFQGSALLDSLTVGENVAFPLRRHRRMEEHTLQEKVLEKLKLVGMEGAKDRMPADLSGGMRKRVGIARALALEPRILLYDEPTAGLDPVTARAVDELILRVQRQTGTTTVLVTHDLVTAFRVAQRIAVLEEGRFVLVGPPQALWESDHPLVLEFLRASSLSTPGGEEGRR